MEGPTPTSLAVLGALQHKSSLYGGTVSAATIRSNRVKNKAARKARRLNRG